MWVVYLVRCADDTLYCGITNDLRARLAAHTAGKGAKYTRGRGPVTLFWSRRCATGREARQLEARIKRLTTTEKRKLREQRARWRALLAYPSARRSSTRAGRAPA